MSVLSRLLVAGIFCVFEGLSADQPFDAEAISLTRSPSGGVCADGATVPGIDVDLFDGTINWNSVAADGIVFAYIRVANGLTEDTQFDQNWDGAAEAGLIRGPVQVLQPSEDAVAQADVLINAIGALTPGDLPPALAVEIVDGQSAATIAAKVGAWLNQVESALGLAPVIYTGRYFWEDNVGSSDYVDHPLWIAHYSTTTCPTPPSPWADWVFWQDSSTGEVDGILGNVNTNIFNGDLSDLAALGVPCADESCNVLLDDGFEGP